VFFDVGLDAGAGSPQVMETQEFVSDELVVWRGLKREELAEKGGGILGPDAALVASAGLEGQCAAVFEPEGAELVEAGFSYIEESARFGGINGSSVEIGDSLADELDGQTVNDLALFIK